MPADEREKYYITTPIYYVNDRAHLGHTYTTLAADTLTRFHRLLGRQAYFLTGTDEHGQKVERAAKAAGITPQQFTDFIAGTWRALWPQLGLQPDFFVRSTEARHAKAVKELFRRCNDAGYIYKASYTGAYCFFDELYASEVQPGEPCPNCGRPTERVTEENYFFKLSAFQDRLLEYYDKHPAFIRPEVRRNEVISFVRGGLKDLSISRSKVKWGIPFPADPEHVFYVWFDALTCYMSGIGYAQGGKDEQRWGQLWPADLHLIGKEILRFHAVYWPAFLMAADLPLPKGLYAHGWLLFEQDKMSKSKGNIVKPQPIQQVVGMDGLRYFLLREIVFGQDGSFSYDALVGRYNSDLANDLGNLSSRTLTMIERYFHGKIPLPADLEDGDRSIATVASDATQKWQQCFRDLEFSRGLEAVWTLVAAVNKYIVENQPWALAEQKNQDRLATVLYTSAEALRIVSVMLGPVMPAAAMKIWQQLGQVDDPGTAGALQLRWGMLPQGQNIGKVEAVFPRLDAGAAVKQMQDLEGQLRKEEEAAKPSAAAAPAAAAPAPDGKIAIDDFTKVEMRVGTVVAAETIPKADKLLKLNVDIGTEVRQVLAGIAQYYKPEELIGRKVVVVANLAPRKMRGLESNGMVVAASVEPEGRPYLVAVPPEVPNGTRLR